MSLKEDLENTIIILNKLREEEGVIIVEGRKDVESLVNLGTKNKIIAVSQRNIFDVIDNIPDKEKIGRASCRERV